MAVVVKLFMQFLVRSVGAVFVPVLWFCVLSFVAVSSAWCLLLRTRYDVLSLCYGFCYHLFGSRSGWGVMGYVIGLFCFLGCFLVRLVVALLY